MNVDSSMLIRQNSQIKILPNDTSSIESDKCIHIDKSHRLSCKFVGGLPLLLLLLVSTWLLTLRTEETSSGAVIVCYYNIQDNTSRSLMPSDLHPHLCTHINIAFARIANKEIQLENDQYKILQEVVKLKSKNPNLKVLLSIGGAGNDKGFSDMIIDHASRKTFIKSIKYFLRNHSIDGVDLDWEFPGVNQYKYKVNKRERQHFSQLLREIRAEYIREKRNYLLTVAVAAQETIVNVAYDVDQINEYVDFVNIMTYDYHYFTKYTPFTGFNSPLFARNSEQLFMATLNINYTVHMYLGKGLSRDKIVVGIPTYGHTFSLVNAQNNQVGAPASGYGSLGNFANYPNICTYVRNNTYNTTLKEDKDAKVPFAYRNQDWISFETPKSVLQKAKFIINHKLKGAMIYSLNADDYEGICEGKLGNNVKFPLSQTVKNILVDNIYI